MRIGSLFLICVVASAFTLGCTYGNYVPELKQMSNKLSVFNAAKNAVTEYAFIIRESRTLGEIDAIMPMDTRFCDATRGRIFVKIYKIAPDYYEPEVRVMYDIDTSEVGSFTGGRPVMQEWRTVFYANALEVKIKNQILVELGMDFKSKKKKMLKAEGYPKPPETEPQKVADAPEEIKKARAALKTKLDPSFEGLTLEAAAKELGKLTGLNIVLTGEATRLAGELGVKIKLNLKNVSAKGVLEQVLNNAGKPFFYHMNKNGIIMIDVFEEFLAPKRGERM
ncbi:MAG: hypothetical protein E3J72_18910 [Planctomycetota bacterium]|nr:MAG: hypothetical protein E3J72_18910 [Planctomycetota bacterium]